MEFKYFKRWELELKYLFLGFMPDVLSSLSSFVLVYLYQYYQGFVYQGYQDLLHLLELLLLCLGLFLVYKSLLF